MFTEQKPVHVDRRTSKRGSIDRTMDTSNMPYLRYSREKTTGGSATSTLATHLGIPMAQRPPSRSTEEIDIKELSEVFLVFFLLI